VLFVASVVKTIAVNEPMTQTADGLAIDLRDVAKIYKGKVHALQGIEMRVRRGEVFGLLGPNGAGKSTLVKIMMTVIRPTRAAGTILGSPVGYKPALRRVGYLPENHRFPRYLTGRQTLEFFSALQKVERPVRKRRSAELLETVGMGAWADKKVSTYSKGMMQRVGLAQALAADPDLVVLDEPTDGVDPVGRRDIRDVLVRLRDQGKTVFVNSHLLSELEMICNRVAILVKGLVAKQGTLDELTVAKQRYDIEVEMGTDPPGQRQKLLGAVRGTFTEVQPAMTAAPVMPPSMMPTGYPPVAPYPPGGAPPGLPGQPPPLGYSGLPPVVRQVPRLPLMRGKLVDGTWAEVEGMTLRVGVTEAAAVQPILDSLRAAGLVIRRVQPMRQSLEDLFMEAVTDPTTGLAATPGAGPGAHPRGGRP
jgi:ABC-2 type transport system ATP-binding protein